MDKIIVTTGAKCATDVNEHLRAGWEVKEIVAEHIAISTAIYDASEDVSFHKMRGHIIVVLTIDDEKHTLMATKFANV